MKKILAVVVLAFSIISCGSDDDGGSSGNSVVGNYLLTGFNIEDAVDLNDDGTASINLIEETNCYMNETIVFNADNTGSSISTSFADIGVEILAGDVNEYSYTIDCTMINEATMFTWTQNGNTISTTDGGNATLDGDTLTIVVPSGFPLEIIESDGITTATTIQNLTFVYTRQ